MNHIHEPREGDLRKKVSGHAGLNALTTAVSCYASKRRGSYAAELVGAVEAIYPLYHHRRLYAVLL
jgi:hypothetical protein